MGRTASTYMSSKRISGFKKKGQGVIILNFNYSKKKDTITSSKKVSSQRDGKKNTSVLDHGIMVVQKRFFKYFILMQLLSA